MRSSPEDLVALRRTLHRYAEPGWCEVGTASIVVETLQSLGWEVRFGRDVIQPKARFGLPSEAVLQEFYESAIRRGSPPEIAMRVRDGFTGVVGILRGGKTGPTISVRMDMDANFGHEASGMAHPPSRLGFRSSHEGIHHNCGHDGHTAIGLGLAYSLAQRRKELPEVRLIFQPAEEGLRGAQSMVDAGVLEGTDLFFGFHIGVQAVQAGELIAGYQKILASLKFDASFNGTSAHAAISPHVGRNSILAAAIATQGLLALPRHGDGETRVNVGRITGGDARNAIPSFARIEAEIRADTTAMLDDLQARAEHVVRGAALMQGVNAAIEFCGRSCAGNSDAELTNFVADVARSIGIVRSVRTAADFKGSDDAAVMMTEVQKAGGQSVYLGLGSPLTAVHHNPSFDFDESVLPFGVEVLGHVILQAANFTGEGYSY
jgi:aminobenzoyl-glutamate utilization protein A